MTIQTILTHLESVAPRAYQESYDNAGLIVGDAAAECTGVLTCLDATEAVIDEALAKGCNLVVAHHPIVFKGLKHITGRNYVERVLLKAIRKDIAIYAIHTNLDNVYARGVNAKIAARLGLQNTRILAPKANLQTASIWAAAEDMEALVQALQDGLAGPQTPQSALDLIQLSATATSVQVAYPSAASGRLRNIVRKFPSAQLISAAGGQTNPLVGSGMVGELPDPMPAMDFLRYLKDRMQVGCVKYTPLLDQPVKRVALCGGAGGFLLGAAKGAGAQVFITADYKYHEFFDADGQLVIADIGHYESEQFTIELLAEIIREKFGTFAVHLMEVNTNPVQYL
ncbi:MAG: Nif3-like dinuclear metal center hexameric protein [Bacteroidota bacterium]